MRNDFFKKLGLKRRDLGWLLAIPVYQTLGTIRHEGAHALMARCQGAEITRFVFWPHFREDWGFLWGYVRYQGDTTWLTTAAPYFADVLTVLLFGAVCFWARKLPRWVWLNLLILGVISPLANSLVNYVGGFYRPKNDVAKLFRVLPTWGVHLFFLVSMSAYAVSAVGLLRRKARWEEEAVGKEAVGNLTER